MSTFRGIMSPGDSGVPVLVPGQPAASLLVQRIKGEAGERMPAGRPALPDEAIAMIEKWVAQGVRYDAPNPDQDILRVAAIAKAQSSTHEQLSADRAALAQQNWGLGMAGAKSESHETKNFFVIGNVGAKKLEESGKKAEAVAPKVAGMFGLPADQPLIKGRMTLFVFNQRYDYSEFGQMVERRELPKQWRGHWRYDIVDAYGAMIAPNDDTYTLDGLVAQQLAGTYLASLNSPPRWFCEGSARIAAARVAPKDPRVKEWTDGLPGVLASMNQPADFLQNRLPPEDADVASFSFVGFLMQDAKRYAALLGGLRAGEDFNKVFAAVYGNPPDKVAELWGQALARRR